jgi:hypothetical protein
MLSQLLSRLATAVLLSLALLTASGAAFAQQEEKQNKADAQSAGKVETDDDDQNAAALEAAANGGSATFGPIAVTVQVDPQYCRTGGVQCVGATLTPGVAAANTNRNPVRLGIQVLNAAGLPVNGLTDAQINVINNFVPAGGPGLGQFSCGTCFQSAGNGMYAIFIRPIPAVNWKSGSYFVQVQVTVGATTHRALAQIEIPF